MQHIDIEDLLAWAYRDQLVGDLIGRGVGLHAIERHAAGMSVYGCSADGVAKIAEIGTLGCRVDGGGAGMALAIHPDAEAVHDAVISLPSKVQRGVIIKCAKMGIRPNCADNARFHMEPVFKTSVVRKKQRDGILGNLPVGPQGDRIRDMAARGLWPERIYDRNRNLIGHRVTVVDHPDYTKTCRWLYAEWYAGLVVLARVVARTLRDHVVTGPAVPAMPWETKYGGTLRGSDVA